MDKEIAELVATIRAAPSRRALADILLAYYNAEGISKVSYHGHYSDGSLRAPATSGFPEDWVQHYIEDHLDSVDPIPQLAAQRVRPFRWSEAQELGKLTDEMIEYLLEMKLAGIGDGLALTVFGPNLRNAYVSLGFESDDFDPSDEKVLEYQWIAQVGHLRFCQLSDRAAENDKELSRREREVLDLIASGKSNSVIATLMKISSHTVDAHVRSIYAKLGVNDRTSAALMGVQRGIVRYPLRK